VCCALLPGWSGVTDARLEPITGGITNELHSVVPLRPDGAESVPEKVVLRVFGIGTESFLDRATETKALFELNALGFGARCLGTFSNGRLEAFLSECRPLTLTEMRASREVSIAIAKSMHRFHQCRVIARLARKSSFSETDARKNETENENENESLPNQTWDVLRAWHGAAMDDVVSASNPRTGDADGSRGASPHARAPQSHANDDDDDDDVDDDDVDEFFLKSLGPEIAALEATLEKLRSPIVLLHNDVLPGNVLVAVSNETGITKPTSADARDASATSVSLTLIDFEYSCYGPRGFDLANHFIEHCGFECDFSNLPTRERRREFCEAYALCEYQSEETARGSSLDQTIRASHAEKTEALLREAEYFYCVSHLWWGLWALAQARRSAVDFDYRAYAAKRFAEFRRVRNETARSRRDETADVFGPR